MLVKHKLTVGLRILNSCKLATSSSNGTNLSDCYLRQGDGGTILLKTEYTENLK